MQKMEKSKINRKGEKMKRMLIVITVLMLIVGCTKEPMNFEKLQERDGLMYEVNSTKPYSGKAISLYENGQKKGEGTFKDGKREGLFVYWHENGQKSQEETFKDGKREGLFVYWYENGKKKSEGTFIDGTPQPDWKYWYKSGNRKN